MEKWVYKKYLRDNITRTYKKSTNSKVIRVELDAKKIIILTVKIIILKIITIIKIIILISDRVDQLQKHNAYIMVKVKKKTFHIIHHLDSSNRQSQTSVKLA